MPIYYVKGTSVVVAVHGDEQAYVDPIATYGISTYIICDYGGPTAKRTDNEFRQDFIFPTITAKMQADSTKLECRRRITQKASDQSQRNIMSHINDIQMNRMTTAPARPATPQEQADMDTSAAIWDWIGAATRAPSSMLGTSDALIQAGDLEWYQDSKWPPWNDAWSAYVARF